MFTTGTRKSPANAETAERHFKDEPDPRAGDEDRGDATIDHEGPIDLDGSDNGGGDPYNTTGRFNQVTLAQKYKSRPFLPTKHRHRRTP